MVAPIRHLGIWFCAGVVLLGTSRVAAQHASRSDHTLYGISASTHTLVRHHFSDDQTQTIGIIRLSKVGLIVEGIEAAAYVPRSSNIIGFWTDPADGLVKLVYISTHTAQATIVGQDLGSGRVTCAVAVKPQHGTPLASDQVTPLSEIMQHETFAVQTQTNVVCDDDGDVEGAGISTSNRLIKVDPRTGVVEQIMALDRAYDGLAASTSQIFYATYGQDLYEINPHAQTQTLIGQLPYSNIRALEFAGSELLGFADDIHDVHDQILAIDAVTSGSLGSVMLMNAEDLRSIVLMRNADSPSTGYFD